MAQSSQETIQTYTHFLKRDKLYNEEKPYSLRFTAPNGFPRANIKLDKHNINIVDVRANKEQLSLDQNGCFVWNLRSCLQYDDFDDRAKIQDVYLAEVADGLRDQLRAAKVQIFEHTVKPPFNAFADSTLIIVRSANATVSFRSPLVSRTTSISQPRLHILVGIALRYWKWLGADDDEIRRYHGAMQWRNSSILGTKKSRSIGSSV